MDSPNQSPDPAFLSPPVPAWARAREARLDAEDCAFFAGAALAALDPLARSAAAFAGVWRSRLALRAAAATVTSSGRPEAEADLRDVWFLRSPGAALGPAGEHVRAWRTLASSASLSEHVLQRVAVSFGLRSETPIAELVALAKREASNPVRAAAQIIVAAVRLDPAAEFLGFWLADYVLADKLRWPKPLPLLAAHIHDSSLRRSAGVRSSRPDDEGFERRVALAYAKAATSAIDRARELSRRADKLMAHQSKLRAKGAGKVVETLLSDDALAPGTRIGGMSDRAMRRIVDRLVELGVARELTQRSTSRLYGL